MNMRLWVRQCGRADKGDVGDLRGRRGDPCWGSSMDSHPVALAGENTTNLIRVGQVKSMRTLSGRYMHTNTHTAHTRLTHSFGKGAQAAHSIGKTTYLKAWKKRGLSTDHLETSGSTISISLPLINSLSIPSFCILHLSTNRSLLFFFFQCTKRPIFLRFGSNGTISHTHRHWKEKHNRKTQIYTHMVWCKVGF